MALRSITWLGGYAVETAKLAQQQILQDADTARLAQTHSVVAEQTLALLKDV